MAALMSKGVEAYPSIKPRTHKNIVLLAATENESLSDLVGAINRARGTSMPVRILEPQEWIDACSEDDEGGKGRAWFEARLVFTQGVCDGDAATVDPAMEVLLGSKPENPDYTWHQNHAR